MSNHFAKTTKPWTIVKLVMIGIREMAGYRVSIPPRPPPPPQQQPQQQQQRGWLFLMRLGGGKRQAKTTAPFWTAIKDKRFFGDECIPPFVAYDAGQLFVSDSSTTGREIRSLTGTVLQPGMGLAVWQGMIDAHCVLGCLRREINVCWNKKRQFQITANGTLIRVSINSAVDVAVHKSRFIARQYIIDSRIGN